MRRAVVLGLLLLLLALVPATAAWAQADRQRDPEAFVVLSGRADVPADQEVGDLVVFHGSATVAGTVNGSVTVFDGPVTISGQVNGDVNVFNGRVELRDSANISGDVVTREAPVVAPGATIGGETRRIQTRFDWNGFGWIGRLALWLAISVSTLVIGLLLVWLAGRGATTLMEAGRTGIGPSIGFGLLLFLGLPVVAILALVTVVGLPFGLGLLGAIGLIYALGYCASAWILGRAILRPPGAWVLAFLAGWAILRVLALIPVLGGLMWFAATAFGLGALAVAIWRGRSAARAAPAAA
ncbi:MAG TPA: polymer-forming cytoskeletal protein [Actinomycetes bacterium]|nr:polymer-forming cytoskeletal protein [Actinomycetes bacterium]